MPGAMRPSAGAWASGAGSRIHQRRHRADTQRHSLVLTPAPHAGRVTLRWPLNLSVLQSSPAEGEDDGTHPGVVGWVNYSGCVGMFSPAPGTPESL